LLVIDQFEQWLHANNRELSGELSRALRHCDGCRLQCLIIVRSDFWLGITRFMRELEVPLIEGINSSHADLFDVRHARHVLTEFGRSYGCLPAVGPKLDAHNQEFIEQAVQQIASDGWVVPVRLALFAEMMKAQEWNLATLEKLGGERGIGIAFLNQVFASSLSAPSHRRFRKAAEAVLRVLLPELGIELKGRSRTHGELQQASGFADQPGQFSELMDILDSQLRLITPTEACISEGAAVGDVDSSGQNATAPPSYQLTHDYLVPALREWLTREQQSTRSGRASLCLEERDRQFQHSQDPRYLPTFSETIRIGMMTDRSSWTTTQSAMMRKALRRHFRQLLIWVCTAAIPVLLFSIFYYANRAADPLITFQNPNLPTATRIAAFDQLDLSSVAALGPLLYTIKSERQPEVLRHAIDGLYELVKPMRATAGPGGDSVQDLILSETEELLNREEIVGGEAEDPIRVTLFSTYASLAELPDVLELTVGAVERNRPLGNGVLLNYLKRVDLHNALEESSSRTQAEGAPESSIRIVTYLVRLMDALPVGDERAQVADLLGRLPAESLVDLFTASFVGKLQRYAERSARIYIDSWPTEDRRRSEARRLLTVLRSRLEMLLTQAAGNAEIHEQLEYVLASVQHLQVDASSWDAEIFNMVRTLLRDRENYRDGAVLDVACAAYAALYGTAMNARQGGLEDLRPLRDILADQLEDVDVRCAAASALRTIEYAAVVDDFALVAKSTSEPARLRSEAVRGLRYIADQRRVRTVETIDIVAVLVQLFDTEQYQSSELLADVVQEVGAIGSIEQLPHVLSMLPRRNYDLNERVQEAVFAILFHNPQMAEQIAEKTLVAIDGLSEEERTDLYPPPEQFLADILRMHFDYSDEAFLTGCRKLVEGLASLSANHETASVRRLALQNLQQFPFAGETPEIDPDGPKEMRQRQLEQWRAKWSEDSDLLRLEDSFQSNGA
jgi:hypothetical protein